MDETTDLGRGSAGDGVVWQPEATEETPDVVAGTFSDAGFVRSYEDEQEPYPAGDHADFGSEDGPDGVELARERIEQTRAALGGTIDAIQEKLSPDNLAQQTKDAVYGATVGKAQNMVSDVTETARGAVSNAGDGAVSAGQTFVETIRRNPIPAALAGIGIGWLIASGRKQPSGTGRSGYRPSYPSYGYGYGGPRYQGGSEQYQTSSPGFVEQAQGTVGQAVNQVQDTAGEVVNQVQGTAGEVVDQVQGTAGLVAGQAQQGATQLAGQAQYGAQQVQSGFQQLVQQQPLAVAAGALALGVAVGLAIPETPQEDQLMGPARSTVMDQVEQKAQQTVQKVEAVAQDALNAATSTAKKQAGEQGLTSPESGDSGPASSTSSKSKASSQSGKGSGRKS